jgi:coenzyme F420-reducing hydrogenase gamma subunit
MKRPRIGVFKFASCDGCQLSILNMEDELLDILELYDIAYFREATDRPLRAEFDLSLVEGSITTDRQRRHIIDIRERSRYLITIGACVYPSPDVVEALSTSTPISEHVYVDYELWGCPIDKEALSETLVSFLAGKRPAIPAHSLCMECKAKGIPCLLVSRREPCLGPITRTGCGVLCPSLERPCYGCFGPMEDANIESLLELFRKNGLSHKECMLLIDKMNTHAYRKVRVEQGL